MNPSSNGNGHVASVPDYNCNPFETTKPEKHAWQFRDQNIPAAICHKIQETKGFSGADLTLCFVINSLVRPQTDKAGKGCWASDGYLSDIVCLHPVSVNRRLHWLQENGFILIFNVGGKRYLETTWSRTIDELNDVEGEYGEALRNAWEKHQKTKGKPFNTDAKTGGKPFNTDAKTPLNPNAKISNLINPKKNKAPAEPVVPLAEQQTPVPTSPVVGIVKNKAVPKKTINPACTEWARRLKTVTELVKRCRLRDVNVFAWGSEFEKVLNKYGDDEFRVEKALRCYEKAAREGKVDGVAWPIINGPKHFGNVFTWLESNAAKVEITAEKKKKSDYFAANGVL